MDELRWILLGVAIVFVLAVYFFNRSRRKDGHRSPIDAANDMPSFSADTDVEDEWVHGVGPVRVVSRDEDEVPDPVARVRPSRDVVPEIDPEPAPRAHTPVEHEPVTDDPYPFPPAQPFASDEESVGEVGVVRSQPEELSPNEDPLEPMAPEPVAEQEGLAEEPDSGDTSKLADEVKSSSLQNEVDDVIAVYVLASEQEPIIKGEKILSASYALKLEHGEMYIFHRYSEDRDRKILFSMANILEPGWFDIEKINQLETRGVSFFMQVNLVDNPSHVLDDMLICAHSMATMLGARLCNPHRQLLDEAYTNSLREKVKKLAEIKAQTV